MPIYATCCGAATLLAFSLTPATPSMDLEDDTTVLTTLKSFNSFIRCAERPQRPSSDSAAAPASGVLQSQYKRSMEVNGHVDEEASLTLTLH